MAKLLPTRLPISMDAQVTSDTYNRLVRVLEINLGQFDPQNTLQVNNTQRDERYLQSSGRSSADIVSVLGRY